MPLEYTIQNPDGSHHWLIRNYRALDGTDSRAIFSPCEKYRYSLRRNWDDYAEDGRCLAFVMLNPSTADERVNDPTVQRCERRARAGGYGGLLILNIFAFRATDPLDMKKVFDPVGPDNDWFLEDALMSEDTIICGWGTHGGWMNRDREVLAMFNAHEREPLALRWTKDAHPQHPLYIGYKEQPHVWQGKKS